MRKRTIKPKHYYASEAWRCVHHKDRSDIMVFGSDRQEWEVIATIWPTREVSAETAANFITHVINTKQQTSDLLSNAKFALEAVLAEGLNFATEQDAEHIITGIKENVR